LIFQKTSIFQPIFKIFTVWAAIGRPFLFDFLPKSRFFIKYPNLSHYGEKL